MIRPVFVYNHGKSVWNILALASLFIFPMSMSANPSVRVAWDPNPETNIAGYKLYYGEVVPGSTNILDVGPMTTASVTNLSFDTAYFFYVTAYNVHALESDPSTVLYYTTPSPLPLSVGTEETLLAFTPVELGIPAVLGGDPDSSVQISWSQLSGPAQVTIQNGDSIEPTVQLAAVGDYSFSVQASDNSTSDQASVVIKVIEPAPVSGGPSPLSLEPPMFLADGFALSWNSKAGANYQVGVKRDLNSPFWILLGSNIASQGDITFWVHDSIDFLDSGFYTVFETPK